MTNLTEELHGQSYHGNSTIEYIRVLYPYSKLFKWVFISLVIGPVCLYCRFVIYCSPWACGRVGRKRAKNFAKFGPPMRIRRKDCENYVHSETIRMGILSYSRLGVIGSSKFQQPVLRYLSRINNRSLRNGDRSSHFQDKPVDFLSLNCWRHSSQSFDNASQNIEMKITNSARQTVNILRVTCHKFQDVEDEVSNIKGGGGWKEEAWHHQSSRLLLVKDFGNEQDAWWGGGYFSPFANRRSRGMVKELVTPPPT